MYLFTKKNSDEIVRYSVAGLLSTTILVRGADSMRIGTLRTAGWCTLGTLASPSCGREIQFYKVNS